jgi:hypothetical protein
MWSLFVGIPTLFSFGESNSQIQKICPHSDLWLTIMPNICLYVYGIYVGTLDIHLYGIIFNCILFLTFICYDIYQFSIQCVSDITNTATYPAAILNLITICILFALNFSHLIRLCCTVNNENKGEKSLLCASSRGGYQLV